VGTHSWERGPPRVVRYRVRACGSSTLDPVGLAMVGTVVDAGTATPTQARHHTHTPSCKGIRASKRGAANISTHKPMLGTSPRPSLQTTLGKCIDAHTLTAQGLRIPNQHTHIHTPHTDIHHAPFTSTEMSLGLVRNRDRRVASDGEDVEKDNRMRVDKLPAGTTRWVYPGASSSGYRGKENRRAHRSGCHTWYTTARVTGRQQQRPVSLGDTSEARPCHQSAAWGAQAPASTPSEQASVYAMQG
jgi:hypothetical protein